MDLKLVVCQRKNVRELYLKTSGPQGFLTQENAIKEEGKMSG
jgi:hypothetical protein